MISVHKLLLYGLKIILYPDCVTRVDMHLNLKHLGLLLFDLMKTVKI